MEPFALILAAVLAQTEAAAPPPPPAMAPPARGLMRADANGDGVVTRAEFLADAAARFDRMDANRDGRLTREEMPMRDDRRGRFGRRGGGDAPMAPPPGADDDR